MEGLKEWKFLSRSKVAANRDDETQVARSKAAVQHCAYNVASIACRGQV